MTQNTISQNNTLWSINKRMARIQKVLSDGVQLWERFFVCFFFSWWGEGESKFHHKRAIIGPQAKRHWMVFRWRADDCPTLNAGLVSLRFFRESRPVLLRNPIFWWLFRGVWTPCPPHPPPLWRVTTSERTPAAATGWFNYILLAKPSP